MTTQKLLIGTRSPGKTREIRDLFAGLPFQIMFPDERFLDRLPLEADLETGVTYAENAIAKARYFARASGMATLADDSGLEVDALAGAPGAYSARFAILEGRADTETGAALELANTRLLLERLEGVAEAQRTARYRCVVAYLSHPEAAPQLVEATCEGRILTAPRGTAGFGYDPVFWSTDLAMGFAEASLAAKQRVSHRGRAFRALLEVLVRRSA